MKKTYFYTFAGITLNAMGNSMTIVTNLGSLLWPASIVNMMHALGWSMMASIFTEGIVVSLLTMLLEKNQSFKEWGEELIFLTPYSILMQAFATVWRAWGIDQLPFWPRLLMDFLGLMISFAGLAMYSDCAWCFHPHDVLSHCLRSRWSPRLMKLFNIFVPLLVIAITFIIKNHTVYALHIGTVVGLLMQSRFTEFCQIEYDKYLHI